MKNESKKRWYAYLWNILFVLVILILIIPSWRVQFQGTVQRFFMTSVKLEKTEDKQIQINVNDWVIYDVNNRPISFHQFGDKPIVLNFWATWCPPCIAELPGLYEFYELIREDAHVIALTNETEEKLKEFQAFKKYPGMIYRYEQAFSGFDFSSYPTTFILAPNFTVVSKIIGAENFATQHNIEFIKSLK